MKGKAIAPSAVPLDMGKHSKLFAQPREMTCQDIHDVCKRFVQTAKQAEKAGFDGVEIHAAHGYLLTQFLSPLTNQRQDEWGGSIINRARLLINIVSQVRAVCAKDFIVMVKLNSADFQKNGFLSMMPVKWLTAWKPWVLMLSSCLAVVMKRLPCKGKLVTTPRWPEKRTSWNLRRHW